ncbi:hypothetical protein QE418_001171 [Microbacterium testaceum]|nr:hypothetical protein [Microbacterium testaceum]
MGASGAVFFEPYGVGTKSFFKMSGLAAASTKKCTGSPPAASSAKRT